MRGCQPDERARALAIPRALQAVTDASAAGIRDSSALRDRALDVLAEGMIALEYVAFVDPETFEPVALVDRPTLVAIAARVGATRLIDNTVIDAGGS